MAGRGVEVLKELRTTKPSFVGSLEIKSSYVLRNKKQSATSIISRLLPRGVTYSGIIHERPLHNLPVRKLAITLGHDGYEPQQQQCKSQRNLLLLREALDADPDNAYLKYKLGIEYELRGSMYESLGCYETAITNCPANISWRLDLVVRLLYVYQQLGLFDNAFVMAEKERALSTLSPDYYFILGNLYLDFAISEPKKGKALLSNIETCWLNCLTIGEVSGVNGAVGGRGSYLAAHNLAAFYQSLGQQEKYLYYSNLFN